jgi:hypothetical protein
VREFSRPERRPDITHQNEYLDSPRPLSAGHVRDRGRPATQIAPVDASRLGKGIGAWLLEDIIGLKAQISSARSAYRRNRRPGAL